MTYIQIGNGQLFYRKHQGGSKIILAFHGFGQNNEIFNDWVSEVDKEYTIYSFDLFHHGLSKRNPGKLSKEEWKGFILDFMKKEEVIEFSVLGFSLGGRFAISTALSFPDSTKKLILIAPDGIYLSVWFKIATLPFLKKLFKHVMYHPTRLEQLFKFNEKIKLVSTYLSEFVKKELGDTENRKRVYNSWNDFKSIGYSKRQLISMFQKHEFERLIILGSKDHVIHPKQIIPFINKMGKFKIEVLPYKHHQLIKPEVAKLILNDSYD